MTIPAIVIMADHGSHNDTDLRTINQEPDPFSSKGRGEQHDGLTRAMPPVSYDDLQQAYQRLLDGETRTASFDWHEGDARARRFPLVQWRIISLLTEYEQTGSAEDSDDSCAYRYCLRAQIKESRGYGYNEWLEKAFEWALRLCYDLCGNYGLAIILFTVLSKVIAFPISVWVQKNSIKMVKMQPEINMPRRSISAIPMLCRGQSAIFKRRAKARLRPSSPLVIQLTLILMGSRRYTPGIMNDSA